VRRQLLPSPKLNASHADKRGAKRSLSAKKRVFLISIFLPLRIRTPTFLRSAPKPNKKCKRAPDVSLRIAAHRALFLTLRSRGAFAL